MEKLIDLDDTEFLLSQAGSRLKRARVDRQMTQGEIAEKCGISERKYRDIEHAVRPPSINVLLHACKHLEADPQIVIFGPSPKGLAISSEVVEEIISGTLEEFCSDHCDVARATKLVTYAYENSLAKKTSFAAELKEVRNLLG